MAKIQKGEKPSIAYFSMEITLESKMPTYAGGLGALAGDTIRSAADLDLPMVAMTLLHRKDYFTQRLQDGWQTETPAPWPIESFVKELPQRASVAIEGRRVAIRAWEYRVKGIGGSEVPVYFLDTDLPENSEWDRTLTDFLYGGDAHYRLCQEVVLGVGGVRLLRALGLRDIARFHMNEGHSSLLALELLDEHARRAARPANEEDIAAVRKLCVFTTHTPVAAGHDQFPLDMVERVLGGKDVYAMKEIFCCEGVLNMTYLALNLSHYVNGVAKRHGEITQLMFARYPIHSITNGVHLATWTAPSIAALLDRHIPDWRHDNFSLRQALSIPKQDIWRAHAAAKETLIRQVNQDAKTSMSNEIFTIGFARRVTAYKRAEMLFHDLDRLKAIGSAIGRLQLVFAGKAHPQDQSGKEIIRRLCLMRESLRGKIEMAFIENYDMDWGRLLTSGSDLWLNTPQAPLEASGTSGMKAAVNAVPSLSIRDGWWIEGHIEGVTGWAIGQENGSDAGHDTAKDADSLYSKLETAIIPAFYGQRDRYLDVMRHAMALNGSTFNTQRMLQQYVVRAYFE